MLKRLAIMLDTIKIAHSVFALPFALLAMVVAASGWPSWQVFLLIVICMVSGRSAAMAFNRLVDREIDARNPRTAMRPSVTGAVSPTYLLVFVLLNALIFVVASGFLNRMCLFLSLPVLGILCGYSLTKRFTAFCHFWLGLALGLAPLGAHLAVRGDLLALPGLGQHWGLPFEFFPLLLGLGVFCWTAGFDLIYACQDYAVDRAEPGLNSLPKRLGISGALRLSSALHLFTVVLFVTVGWYAQLGAWFYGALSMVAGLLYYEHRIVRPNDLSRVNMAFFTLNGAVSLLLFLAVFVERVLLNP